MTAAAQRSAPEIVYIEASKRTPEAGALAPCLLGIFADTGTSEAKITLFVSRGWRSHPGLWRAVTERTMGWIVFALWLLLSPIWITYWFSAQSPKMALIPPPALVLIALALAWLWRQFVVLVAGEAEPSPRGRIRELTADWRAERDLIFRPRRSLHPVWGMALPSRGTIRISLIAAAVGAWFGAAAVSNRSNFAPKVSSNDAASRLIDRSSFPVSVRTETVKPLALSAESSTQNKIPSNSPVTPSDGNAPLQRAEVLPPSINAQNSSDQPNSFDRPGCDVSLCERSYRSFRASDCTYQPYEGPRQYCAR
jgi:BA14K-like protein